jgi:hypothetical protein
MLGQTPIFIIFPSGVASQLKAVVFMLKIKWNAMKSFKKMFIVLEPYEIIFYFEKGLI